MNKNVNAWLTFPVFLIIITLHLPLQMKGAIKQDQLQTKTVSVTPFRELKVVGNRNTEVILHIKDEYRIVITTERSKKINVENSKSVLLVSSIGIDSAKFVKIDIYAPSYGIISSSFVRLMSSQNIIADTLSITANETDLDLSLNTNVLNLEWNGGKQAVLGGVCQNANFTCRGFNNGLFSSFDAEQLAVRNLHIACGILNDIKINVSDSLWLVGGVDSKISIKGFPLILQNDLKDCELKMNESF